MRTNSHGTRKAVFAVCVVAALTGALTAIAVAQTGGSDPSGGYTTTTTGGRGGGGGGGGGGQLKLKLTAKKTQKSLKAVKVKATCENQACTINAKGNLKAGKKKAKLKPDEESLTAGGTDSLKLKFAKKAKKTAKSAAKRDQKLSAKITAKAQGVGGGGSDSASLKVKIKP